MIAAIASALVPTAFVVAWLVEARRPARAYPTVPGWQRLGAIFFVIIAVVGSATPMLLAHTFVAEPRLLHLASLGFWALPLGILVTSAVHYAWHRASHRFDLLWRVSHQLHHSPQRVDIPGAFYAHPVEAIAKSALAFLVTITVLGLDPEVASTTSSLLALLSVFQHWNVRTPRWLGWFLPRPEMHALHHEANVHGRNYGDLPIWDMLFGTYENPATFEGNVGFTSAASGRLRDMLLMRDVNRPLP